MAATGDIRLEAGKCSDWRPPESWDCQPLSIFSSIRVKGETVEIEQMVGGTRNAYYAYIEDDSGLLTNVKHVPGAKLVLRENWGRRRRREVYSLPLRAVEGKTILYFSYTTSGYISVEVCRICDGVTSCYQCVNESEVCESYVTRFRVAGTVKSFAEFYVHFIPGLVEDMKRIMAKAGTDLLFLGHAVRIEEALEDPMLSVHHSDPEYVARPTPLATDENFEGI